MDRNEEDKALSPAVDRIDSRFPDVSRDEVEQIVAEVQEQFADRPVRDHIPNLVEHEVRARLSEAHPAHHPDPSEPVDGVTDEDLGGVRQPS